MSEMTRAWDMGDHALILIDTKGGAEVVKKIPKEPGEPVTQKLVGPGVLIKGKPKNKKNQHGRVGVAQKAYNLATATAEYVKAGRPKATQEQVDRRFEICSKCEFLLKDKMECGRCGCPIKKIVGPLSKLTWATSRCPAHKWGALDRDGGDLSKFYDNVYVISLSRRPERLKEFWRNFPKDWPFARPVHYPAVDGKACQPPAWWTQGPGAWGCYRSHYQIIEKTLSERGGNTLILEDDAYVMSDFVEAARKFTQDLPEDWDMAYYGGQHLAKKPITEVKKGALYRAGNVNRTHAYAVSKKGMLPVYKHLSNTKKWVPRHHIDHHYGALHETGRINVYCPVEWMVGQGKWAGKSDISGRKPNADRYWAKRCDTIDPKNADAPFIAIVGMHGSGTSATAGVLWSLGVYLGDVLNGYWGDKPGEKCGYEAVGIRTICENAIKIPQVAYLKKKGEMYWGLHNWISGAQAKASRTGVLAGAKHPLLSRMGDQLINICGSQLIVVDVYRPVHLAVKSLAKRYPGVPVEQLRKHQEWLKAGKEDLARRASKVVRVNFGHLRAQPEKTITKLVKDFNGILKPTKEQYRNAVLSVR